MGLFDHFPYTNFHELNLDWMLRMLQEIDKTMDEFVAINALKYADPIQWNITSQYEKNTIVIDPQTGTAYISVAPVPIGVSLTNTDYWTVVFDLGSFVVRAAKNLANTYEDDTTLTATVPTLAGGWIVWGDTLYRAKVNITAGDTYVVDGNIEHFTIEDVIGHLEDLNTTDKSNLVAAINELLQTITGTCGDLDDLNTTDKSNLVAAVNEVFQTLQDTCGDLNDLNTTDKSNLVAAINEIADEVLGKIGDLDDLNTVDQSNIVNAINEVLSDVGIEAGDRANADADIIARIDALDVYNVMDYGAVGDGTTDDSAAIAAALADMTSGGILYFPAKQFRWDTGIDITSPCTICFNNSEIICNDATAQISIKTDDVDIVGKATFTASSGKRLVYINSGYKRININLNCVVSGFTATALIDGLKADRIRVIGRYYTADSMIVHFDGCSFVEVSGINAHYSSSPTLGPVVFTDKDSTHTYHDIHIHDIYTNGGGVLNNGNISITRLEQVNGFTGNNFNYVYNVEIDHVVATNCPYPTDGLDVLFCNHSTIHDIRINNCNKGLVLMGQLLTVTNCVISECLRAGIFFGDQNMGSGGTVWSNILVSNCIVKNNGQSGTYPANFAADQPATCYVTNIFIENCIAYGSPYVFDLGNNTGGGGIRLSGGFGAYTTARYRCNTGDDHMFKFTNISGTNPFKFVTSPTIDTVNVTNTYPCDVFVCFRNGSTAQQLYIDDVATLTLQAGMIESFILPKGSKVRVSVDATGCAWTWYGL